MKKNLIIFGNAEQAELAHYYFKNDTDYKISAFTVDGQFIRENTFCNLPVIPFEDLPILYTPSDYSFFIALGYKKLNLVRKEKYLAVKSMGYDCASYISTRASFLNANSIGDNCFILEENTVQPFTIIGNNVTLWSGNHIGHHTIINDHSFITSHVVISGGVEIGEQCFIGVNATIRDHITIGEKSVIGAGTLILSNVEPEGVYMGKATERSKVPSTKLRGI